MIGLLVITATLFLVGVAGEQDHAAAQAVGLEGQTPGQTFGQSPAQSPAQSTVPVLAIAALTTLLGGSWFIARRLRDLRAMDRNNRRLSEALVEAADAERTRIGRNLHDDLGQHLTAIGMLSVSLRRRLSQASPNLATDAARLAELAEEAGQRTRQLTRACLIDWTESAGLVRSLGMLCASASDLFNVDIETRIDERFDATDPATASHIARIVSEAINNAVRHAQPRSIIVSLQAIEPRRARHAAQAGALRAELVIEDHRGDSAPRTTPADAAAEPGLGMLIMRARAQAIGAELEAIDRDGHGLTIRCAFTWKPPHTHRRERAPKDQSTDQQQRIDQTIRIFDRIGPLAMRDINQPAAVPAIHLRANQQPANQQQA